MFRANPSRICWGWLIWRSHVLCWILLYMTYLWNIHLWEGFVLPYIAIVSFFASWLTKCHDKYQTAFWYHYHVVIYHVVWMQGKSEDHNLTSNQRHQVRLWIVSLRNSYSSPNNPPNAWKKRHSFDIVRKRHTRALGSVLTSPCWPLQFHLAKSLSNKQIVDLILPKNLKTV